MKIKYVLLIFTLTLIFAKPGFSQQPTFGEMISDVFLPSSIDAKTPLDCARYFHIADSINARVFQLTGVNPIPGYRCGNDSLTYTKASINEAILEIPSGSILARLIIDRYGQLICCKVYVKEGTNPGKEVERAFSKITLTPGYRNGEPIPTECRFIYDFQKPKLPSKKIID